MEKLEKNLSRALVIMASLENVAVKFKFFRLSYFHYWQACLGLICLIGFTIQAGLMTMSYLSFSTIREVSVLTEKFVDPPGFTLCVRIVDMIEPSVTEGKLGHLAEFRTLDKVSPAYEDFVLDRMSLRNVFEWTPNITLMKCRIRKPGHINVLTLNEISCHEHLQVTKVAMQNRICYQTKMVLKGQYHFGTTMRTIQFPGLAFQPFFDDNYFNHSLYAIPIVHRQSGNGENSRLYATTTHWMGAGTEKQNFVRISYWRRIINRLPYPYDTRCLAISKPLPLKALCYKRCKIESVIRNFGKLPFSELYTLNDLSSNFSGLTILNSNQFDDNRLNDLIVKLGTDCNQSCRIECHREDYITSIRHAAYYGFLPGISFRLDLPYEPYVKVTFKPALKFNEFLIYVMSCLGAWLGVSMIQLNPFKRKHQEHKRTLASNRTCLCNCSKVNLILELQAYRSKLLELERNFISLNEKLK